VVTVLAVVGLTAHALRPYVPAIGENAMDREKEPFLRAGRLQPIPWQRFGPETLEKARQTDRPVLLFIGLTTSRIARDFDEALLDPDASRLVTRRFVCARIDGLEHPQWANAFFPVSRLQLGFQAEAQVWILDSDGRPFDVMTRSSTAPLPSGSGLLNSLREALDRYGEIRRNGNTSALADVQRMDRQRLTRTTRQNRIDLEGYRLSLRAAVDAKGGSFPIKGLRQPRPHAHRFLLTIGDRITAREALDPLLRSPQRDLVEGGFFHVSMGASPWYVEFDKWTMETASMAHTLALAYCLLRDATYRDAATDCLDALMGPLMGEEYLTAGEAGITYGRDRSERHSFPPRRLTELLSPEEADWAVENLGLDLAQNPQAIPYLRMAPHLQELDNVLTKLRVPPPAVERAKEGYANIHLGALARGIHAARLLGDAPRLKALTRRLDKTWASFVTSPGYIRRVADAEGQAPGLLTDHLAYVDAKLQNYLSTGRHASLIDGRNALRRTIQRFRTSPGEFVATPASGTSDMTAVPELADNLQESTTAQAIRLLLAYGRLFVNRPEGSEFLNEAYAALYRYGEFAIDGGPTTAGFFTSAAEVMDDGYAICAGPNAQRLADNLVRRCPTRLVAPASGDIRRDVANRGPGIYLIQRGTLRGPYNPEQAARLLGATLEPTR
jgi:uncharacterized protein YyaL (SSP411 family)